MKRFSMAFLKGLAAGALIHAAARIATWSIEEVSHFMGHVTALVTLEMLRRHQG